MAQNAEEEYEVTRMEDAAIPSVTDWELLAEEGDAHVAKDEGKTHEVQNQLKTTKSNTPRQGKHGLKRHCMICS